MKKLIIENYYKFLETHPKYFKSPLLNMDRYGFIQLGIIEKDKEKTRHIINRILLFREIQQGHIVWRILKNGWGEPFVQVFYNKKILDKYGSQI